MTKTARPQELGYFCPLKANRIYEGDARELLAQLPDGYADLILTDPPYGIDGDTLDKHYNRDGSQVVPGYVEVAREQYAAFSRAWIAEAARVVKPGGAVYIVSGYSCLYEILAALKATDLVEINHIIWSYQFGPRTSRKWVSSHYHVLHWERPGRDRTYNLECRHPLSAKDPKTARSMNYQDRRDVWDIPREYRTGKARYQNQLPEALVKKILAYSSRPRDVVLDPFTGGGTVPVVAWKMARQFLAFDLNPHAVAFTKAELEKARLSCDPEKTQPEGTGGIPPLGIVPGGGA